MKYGKVMKDFKSGVLDKNNVLLVIDSDSGYWQSLNEDCEKADVIEARLRKKYGEPGGYSDMVDILIAAGVPAEWS